MMWAVYGITFLLFVQHAASYNILVLFGHMGKSHYDVFKPLFQELGERGHNITILSHVKTQGDIKNSRDVLLSNVPLVNHLDLKHFTQSHLQRYTEVAFLAYFSDFACNSSLQSEELQKFLQEDQHFDVILAEFFNSNCLYGLITKYKAPFIGLSSCAMMHWHPRWFGAPDNPAYVNSIYMAYPAPMSFLQRMENTLMHLVNIFWYKTYMEQPGREYSLKYTGFEPADPHQASLLLVNTHYTLHGVQPLTPAIVEVGGLHVTNKKPKKLPEDVERWTNESTSGLIYFSLGSLIKGHTFPEGQLGAFMKVFSKLPQRVLWKWEEQTMKDKPDNIMLTEWAPQYDVLCHPNTVLFISHGGLLGTTEAIHCGVPVIVMPQFGDQRMNAKLLEKQGAGVILKLLDATEETITEALTKALSKVTRQKAKELSNRFRDRLVSPLESSVYWIEHVARHKGAKHLRSEAIEMPFYQYLLLDVIGCLLIGILALLYAARKIGLLIVRTCCGGKKKKLL
ncbi:unnamed protein product [Ceutorhynchus assimilis]|uniref:UDP-glucuronosyltransferase n=1 Tax=Ceutorhynchus assimilis TaxID=467358 RepID=A0A9N9QAW6_9CUCU|nr:unnamed protein product [Ceutorhynchus assimilis]